MANEAVIIELLGAPGNKGEIVNYTCADQNAIAKGTLVVLTNPRTISGSSALKSSFAAAGITSSEKVASDGQTQLGVYTKGIFDCYSGTVVNAGHLMKISGVYYVVVTADIEDVISGCVLSKSLESATANDVVANKLVML